MVMATVLGVLLPLFLLLALRTRKITSKVNSSMLIVLVTLRSQQAPGAYGTRCT
jgi:hypothetical protein